MTKEYEEKLRRDREALYERRKEHQRKSIQERDRIKALFQKRGIPEYRPGIDSFHRIVKIEILVDYIYEDTCFKIPEDIDLKKVVQWIVHDTYLGECTVFLDGAPATTIRCDYDLDYFFRHYGSYANKNEGGETK